MGQITAAQIVVAGQSVPVSGGPWLLGSGYDIKNGDDLAAAVAKLAAGAAPSVQPGTYRLPVGLTVIPPNLNATWPGVVLDGSVTLTGWTAQTGGLWYLDGKLPAGTADVANGGGIQPEYSAGHPAGAWNNPMLNDACLKREQLWIEDNPASPLHLTRVMGQQWVTSGRFFADYAANRIWIADDPTKHVMKLSLTPFAIQTNASPHLAQFEARYFATPAQRGAVWMTGGSPTIDSVVAHYSHAHGIYLANLTGAWAMSGHRGEDNGQGGASVYNCTGGVVQGAWTGMRNGTDGFRELDGENGGLKASQNNGTQFLGGTLHDNKGLGFWFDLVNRNVLLRGADIQGNTADGFRGEIGQGITIDTCHVANNCLNQLTAYGANNGSPFECAEIHFANSTGAVATSNVVIATLNGLMYDMRDRVVNGVATSSSGTATGNDVTMKGTAPVLGVSGKGYYQSDVAPQLPGIAFDANTWRFDSVAAARLKLGSGSAAFAAWQAAGNDIHGKVLTA